MKLFDDDDGQNEDISKIEIDKEYACKFEHNKKREDLQRYEELKKKGLIEESEESDDESEESESEEDNNRTIMSKQKDLEFFSALIKVRNQDPSLKKKDIKLFESDESEDESEGESENEEDDAKREKGKKKAMYLKDVVAKHLIEEGPEFKDEEEHLNGKEERKKTYDEEQEELRKAFLDAAEVAEDNDQSDFLTLKANHQKFDDGDNQAFVNKLDEYFGRDGELDESNVFLKEFFMNKMWVDKGNKYNKEIVDEDEVDDLVRDEEEIERQEEYETNYRYEEKAGDRVMGHSRKMEGSVRKKENARKDQRKNKEERMKIAGLERQEELKHLKNLKKKEIKERMRKVFAIAGFKDGEDCPFNSEDLEDEFDPEEYDKMMNAAFDEKYYDAEDTDPEFGSDREDEKPDFDKEDELLGLPKGWDVLQSNDGFLAARERCLKHKSENVGHSEGEEEGDEELEEEEEPAEETAEGKRKRKRKISLVKRAREEMMEEYYKLDYEDTVGDLKTRFKYAKIKPNRYGLSAAEILMMDEKDLNQYVSLKKIAPYRKNEWKIPSNKRYQQKMKNKELLQGGKEYDQKTGKKKLRKDDGKFTSTAGKLDYQKSEKEKRSRDDAYELTLATGDQSDEKAQVEESNGDMGNLSRKAKRRRRQAELKLSYSRQIAYGKVSSKSKSK